MEKQEVSEARKTKRKTSDNKNLGDERMRNKPMGCWIRQPEPPSTLSGVLLLDCCCSREITRDYGADLVHDIHRGEFSFVQTYDWEISILIMH